MSGPQNSKNAPVNHIEQITNDLRLIRFETELENVPYEPAYAIGIRINDRDFRNYSPFNFNKEAGTFDVLFHLHDMSAAGSHFVTRLREGDSIKLLMPRGKQFFTQGARIHFLWEMKHH